MKITIVQGPFFPIPPVLGGAVEKIWYSLGKEFANLGHDVTHVSKLYNDFSKNEKLEGVNYIRVDGFNSPKFIISSILLDLIYAYRVIKILPYADILITNTISLPLLIRTKKYGLLYIHIQRYPKAQIRFYNHAQRIQTVSNFIGKAIYEKYPNLKNKIAVIPNPVSTKFKDIDFNKSWQNRENFILYVGRIHPEKGIDILIKAFKKFINSVNKGWKLQIIGAWEYKNGGGGLDYFKKLRKLTANIEKYVIWTGPIFNEKDLNNYLYNAKLFVYPSLAEKGEALPLAPLEAMSCGCVPLVSSLDCFRDFIEDGNTGFIFNHRSKNPEYNLYCKIVKILNRENSLKTISEKSYRKAKEFSYDRIAKFYINDFQKCLKVI